MSAVDGDGDGGRVRRRRGKPPRWLVAVLGFLAILGPGLISANAGNDAGGIITYASTGSQFGYRMLFLMVLITVALVIVQEMCARLDRGVAGPGRDPVGPAGDEPGEVTELVPGVGVQPAGRVGYPPGQLAERRC